MTAKRVLVAVLATWASGARAMPGSPPATAPRAPKTINAFATVRGPGGEVKAPLFAEQSAGIAIAQVDDEVITLGELASALIDMHEDHSAKQTSAGKTPYEATLDRLIAIRLVSREAQDMGLHELPEVTDLLAKFERGAARDLLKRRATASLKPDAIEVERLYKDETRQFKIRSLLFSQPKDAQAFAEAVRAGGDFDGLGQKAIADKKASGTTKSDWLPKQQAIPQVVATLSGMGRGQISTVAVDNGMVAVTIDEIRHADDPEAKARAEALSLERQREATLQAYARSLVKKHAKIEQAVVDALDFEKKGVAGYEELMKDGRVLARISDGGTITVADLAKEVRAGFFHGMEGPIQEKKVNKKKESSFNLLVQKAAYDAEVKLQKIHESDEFKRAYEEYRGSVLFGAFLKRAIMPGVTVTEGDAKKHYEAHKKEYSYPAFFRLNSLAFSARSGAQSALDKLKKGTDFKWLRANADGQLAQDKRAFELDSQVLTDSGMTPALARLLQGARKGDLRILEQDGGFYVIQVKEVTPPSPQPYAEAREAIANKLHGEKLNKALAEWVTKLRKAHEVKVYITKLSTT